MQTSDAHALVAALGEAFKAPADDYTQRHVNQVERYWAEGQRDGDWQVVLLWRQDELAYGVRMSEVNDYAVTATDERPATATQAAYDIRDFLVVEPHGRQGKTADAKGRLWFADDEYGRYTNHPLRTIGPPAASYDHAADDLNLVGPGGYDNRPSGVHVASLRVASTSASQWSGHDRAIAGWRFSSVANVFVRTSKGPGTSLRGAPGSRPDSLDRPIRARNRSCAGVSSAAIGAVTS